MRRIPRRWPRYQSRRHATTPHHHQHYRRRSPAHSQPRLIRMSSSSPSEGAPALPIRQTLTLTLTLLQWICSPPSSVQMRGASCSDRQSCRPARHTPTLARTLPLTRPRCHLCRPRSSRPRARRLAHPRRRPPMRMPSTHDERSLASCSSQVTRSFAPTAQARVLVPPLMAPPLPQHPAWAERAIDIRASTATAPCDRPPSPARAQVVQVVAVVARQVVRAPEVDRYRCRDSCSCIQRYTESSCAHRLRQSWKLHAAQHTIHCDQTRTLLCLTLLFQPWRPGVAA